MEKTFPFIVAIGLFLFGCSGNNQGNVESPVNIDQFNSYAIDVESKPVSIFELIEHVEVLGLEETEESLLPNFYSIQSLDKGFVFHDPKRGKVFVYDEYGDFKNSFSKIGNGPKEVSFMLNVWVEGDTIAVFDAGLLRIQKFDKLGNYLSTLRVPPYISEIAHFNDRYYLDASNRIQEDGGIFGVLILDRRMQLVEEAIPLIAKKPAAIFWRSPFIPYKDKFTYHDVLRDTVYVTDNGGFKPLLSIDFGTRWAWRDQSILLDRAEARAMLRRRGFVNKFQAIVGSHYVVIQNFWESKIQNHLVNRSTGVVQRLRVDKKSMEGFSLVPFRWEGDYLLASLASTDLAEFTEALDTDKVKLRGNTTLEEIESSENPVLVWIKFK